MPIRPFIHLLTSAVVTSALWSSPRIAEAQVDAPGVLHVSTIPTAETRGANTGPFTATFTVSNSSPSTVTAIGLVCSSTTPVTCGTVNPTFRASLASGASFNVSVGYSVGASGTGILRLTATDDAGDSGLGERTVTVGTTAPPVVVLRNHNRDNVDRSLCLTAGAGEAAAWSCGDLVITHSMPGYSTLGRERALTLIHNSATAHPRPPIAAIVTQPNGAAPPNTVFAELKVGGTVRNSATYQGWSGGTGGARQIVLDFNADGDATGAYPIELRVQNQYTGSVLETLVKDTLLIVNRFVDEFGAGFGIAGLEQLFFNQPVGTALGHILWVGGDGSGKLYRKLNASTWVAPLGAFQDTISLSGGVYTRKLRHGVQVKFNSTGRHTATINRVGHQTTFTWNGAGNRLVSIAVPPAGVAGTVYTLAWDGINNLDSIVDGGGRKLNATVAADGRLTSLLDPDGFSVSLGWDGDRRITSRTNRRGFTTTYQYSSGRVVGSRISKVTIPAGSVVSDTATAVTVYDAWNDKGLATGPTGQNAIDTSLAYTKIYGPRSPSVADTAAFRVDRWGAPTKLVDAVGATTTMVRADAARPALVTQVTYPSGRIVNMTYTSRGNLAQVQDVNTGLPTRVTNYLYKSPVTADSPDTVRDALNRKTRYAYNSMGLTDSVIDPLDHRSKFFYRASTDPLKGAIDSIAERAVETWRQSDFLESTRDQVQRFGYEIKGNLKTSTGPTGLMTSYVRDASTRVIGTYDPVGTRRSMSYDAMNRVTRDSQYTARNSNPYNIDPLAGCDASQLSCADTTPATFVPSLPTSLVTQYVYDALTLGTVLDPRLIGRGFVPDNRGLPRRETDEFGISRTGNYDRGGLLTSTVSRLGETVRYRYDDAGRKTAMIFPLRDYSDGCQPSPACVTALQVPGDSVSYGYDISGNLLVARNQEGTISRTYYSDGSLKRKISAFNNLIPDTLMYEYDAVGALTRVIHGRDVRDTTTYRYNTAKGTLDTLDFRAAGLGTTYRVRFQYDGLGRRRQVTYPNSTVVTLRYDVGGTLRQLISSHPGGPSADILDFTLRQEQVNPAGVIRRETMVCAPAISVGNPCGLTSARTTLNGYNRLGMLVRQEVNTKADSMGYDASGNLVFRWDEIAAQLHTFTHISSPVSNRMQADAADQMNYTYFNDGGRDREYSSSSAYRTRFYYYDGVGRMTGTWHFANVDGFLQMYNNANACLFDADGQILKPCHNGAPKLAYDGHNVVATPIAGTNASTWRFVHGPGLDDPLLGLWRGANNAKQVYYWVTDGQGRQYAFADSTGALSGIDYTQRYGDDGGEYAGGTSSASTFQANRFGSPELPGLSFFRNRAYDQQTGRWTQEDPIGVAGGLNLYQFNGNNPVTFTDPFGLKECEQKGNCTQGDGGQTPILSRERARADAIISTDASPMFFLGGFQRAEAEVAGVAAQTAITGTKAAVRKGLSSLGLDAAVEKGVRRVLGSGAGQQWGVEAGEGGGAMVSRYVAGADGTSSAIYTYLVDAAGKMTNLLQRGFDAAGNLTHFDPIK